MSIRVDPGTGLTIFNTRAAKANDKIAGKGYSIITDEALITLPPKPREAVFNVEEQAKYQAFKEARRGAADYMAMEGEFSKYLEDVYSAEPVPREALTDACEILVVGAGFAGHLEHVREPVDHMGLQVFSDFRVQERHQIRSSF